MVAGVRSAWQAAAVDGAAQRGRGSGCGGGGWRGTTRRGRKASGGGRRNATGMEGMQRAGAGAAAACAGWNELCVRVRESARTVGKISCRRSEATTDRGKIFLSRARQCIPPGKIWFDHSGTHRHFITCNPACKLGPTGACDQSHGGNKFRGRY
jgi:hypothetical protein